MLPFTQLLLQWIRQMDHGVKTDIWSVMEDFSKVPGGQDFSKLKSQYSLFVDALGSNQVFQLTTLCM